MSITILAVECTAEDLRPILDVPAEIVTISAADLPLPKNLFGGYDLIALGNEVAVAAFLLCAMAQGREETMPRAMFRRGDREWYDKPS